MKVRHLYAGIALGAAVLLGLLSFLLHDGEITANMLILVAQFLLYSLTMVGLGTAVVKILEMIRPKRP